MTMGSTNEIKLATVSRRLCRPHCRPHLEKAVRSCQFLTLFMCNLALPIQSRAHFVVLFKKGSEAVSFWQFLCDQLLDDDVVDRWNEALAAVARALGRPHCRPHLQKVVRTRQFLMPFMRNRTVATVSCTFCRPLSGKRRAPAETETLQRRPPTATLPKHRVLCRRVFSANSLFPDRSLFPTTWWWYDWHDDVVDMMVRQLAVRIVRNSETKLPLISALYIWIYI